MEEADGSFHWSERRDSGLPWEFVEAPMERDSTEAYATSIEVHSYCRMGARGKFHVQLHLIFGGNIHELSWDKFLFIYMEASVDLHGQKFTFSMKV